MKESCVCCQAERAKADGPTANIVLLWTHATMPGADIGRTIDALCKKHGARLDRLIYASMVKPTPKRKGKRRRKVKQ